MKKIFDIDKLDWQKTDGLIPAIIQNYKSKKILMLGYMNKQALKQTLETKKVTFFSRTKNRLWQKGEESGNILELISIAEDCDQDTILIQVKPEGNTCHLGKESCFDL